MHGGWTRIAVGGAGRGLAATTRDAEAVAGALRAGRRHPADDPLLLYFTSGTTARPKLVEHTHTSYPVGHLSTMYWIGLRPGDVHLNISSPGWAKHAWSNVFAPWNAEATVLVYNYARFDAAPLLASWSACGVTTLLRAADGLADARSRRTSPRLRTCRCARWSAPASRSTPRSSSRSGGPGG